MGEELASPTTGTYKKEEWSNKHRIGIGTAVRLSI